MLFDQDFFILEDIFFPSLWKCFYSGVLKSKTEKCGPNYALVNWILK